MKSIEAAETVRTFEVRDLARGEEREWDAFVEASRYGTFFHLSGWKAVIENVLGHRSHFLAARDARRRIHGVLPASLVRSRIFGNCLVSLPLAVYGGACADREEPFRALLQAANETGRKARVNYVELRNRSEPYPCDLPGRDLYATFTKDLSAGPDQFMKGLPRDTRYAIRKSMKSGLEWVKDLDIADFYPIFAQNVHRLGTPVFGRRLFVRLREEFGERCRISGVSKGGRLIAVVLSFYFRDQVLPYYAGALPEYFADAPNNFMYWKLICQSYDEGYRQFDFGRSKRGTGPFEFKSSWSMDVTPLPYRYQLIRAKEVPRLSPVDGKFRAATGIWKRMPLRLATAVGPHVIRLIPSV